MSLKFSPAGSIPASIVSRPVPSTNNGCASPMLAKTIDGDLSLHRFHRAGEDHRFQSHSLEAQTKGLQMGFPCRQQKNPTAALRAHP